MTTRHRAPRPPPAKGIFAQVTGFAHAMPMSTPADPVADFVAALLAIIDGLCRALAEHAADEATRGLRARCLTRLTERLHQMADDIAAAAPHDPPGLIPTPAHRGASPRPPSPSWSRRRPSTPLLPPRGRGKAWALACARATGTRDDDAASAPMTGPPGWLTSGPWHDLPVRFGPDRPAPPRAQIVPYSR